MKGLWGLMILCLQHFYRFETFKSKRSEGKNYSEMSLFTLLISNDMQNISHTEGQWAYLNIHSLYEEINWALCIKILNVWSVWFIKQIYPIDRFVHVQNDIWGYSLQQKTRKNLYPLKSWVLNKLAHKRVSCSCKNKWRSFFCINMVWWYAWQEK